MDMASLDANQIDFKDSSLDEDCAVKNLTLKNTRSIFSGKSWVIFLEYPSSERGRKSKKELQARLQIFLRQENVYKNFKQK